jgi:hypothetical protein
MRALSVVRWKSRVSGLCQAGKPDAALTSASAREREYATTPGSCPSAIGSGRPAAVLTLTHGKRLDLAEVHLCGPSTRWEIMGSNANAVYREPWNKGKIVGQKAPFKLKEIWALRVRLQMES